jgi:hypothetical protein
LTIATAIPAAASALASGISKPPVASRTTKSVGFDFDNPAWPTFDIQIWPIPTCFDRSPFRAL